MLRPKNEGAQNQKIHRSLWKVYTSFDHVFPMYFYKSIVYHFLSKCKGEAATSR